MSHIMNESNRNLTTSNPLMISHAYVESLKKKNAELLNKLEMTKQAPLLMKNMFSELQTAESRVKKLQERLEEKTNDGKDSKEKYEQLRRAVKRASDLNTRIASAHRQNRLMQSKLQEQAQLERKLKSAGMEMEKVLAALDLTNKRSRWLEQELEVTRKHEREVKDFNLKLKYMESDLNEANRKIQLVQNALQDANKKWMRAPREVMRVEVQRGSRQMEATHTGVYGRQMNNVVKVTTLDSSQQATTTRSSRKVAVSRSTNVPLRYQVGELERKNDDYQIKNRTVSHENQRLVSEARRLKEALEKMGFSVGRENNADKQTV